MNCNINEASVVCSIAMRLYVVLILFVSACGTLEPVQLPDENTQAPSDASFWQSLEEIRPNNWFVLLNDGKNALDWRLMAIDSAVESIDLQTFLWNFDTAGSLILDHIVSAADRGVMIKILIDDTFLISEDRMLVSLANHPKIEYRVFNPFKHRASGFVSREFLNLTEFHRLDHRMHNKAMIVDNQIAIVGGRNLADEYFGLNSEANFRDMELLAGGPIVQEVTASFDNYFNDDWSLPIDMVTHIEPNFIDLNSVRHQRDPGVYEYEDTSPNAGSKASALGGCRARGFWGRGVSFCGQTTGRKPRCRLKCTGAACHADGGVAR